MTDLRLPSSHDLRRWRREQAIRRLLTGLGLILSWCVMWAGGYLHGRRAAEARVLRAVVASAELAEASDRAVSAAQRLRWTYYRAIGEGRMFAEGSE